MRAPTYRRGLLGLPLFALLGACGGVVAASPSDGGEVRPDAGADLAPGPDPIVPDAGRDGTFEPLPEAGPDAVPDAGCPDFSARLAAAMADCAAPMPGRKVDGDESAIADFKPFVVGRWLSCPSSTGAPIPGPSGNVGVEFTAEGRAIFLRVACDGAIVRGSGGGPIDGGPPQTWDNRYEILDPGGQLNVYYGDPWTREAIVHATFDPSPKRIGFDNEGVFQGMYVVAPERL